MLPHDFISIVSLLLLFIRSVLSNSLLPYGLYVACQAPLFSGFPGQEYWSDRHLKTHYWTLHCTPERGNPAPPTRTPTQASLIRKPCQATRPTPPTGRNLHSKEEPQTARIQKGHPKHSNLNKMKRQRNTQQVKEHDKCPPNQTKKEEIGSLPEKEFRMIVKIQNLENKMKLHINRLETKLEKTQEMFNKHLEEIKKNQSIMQ